MYVENLKLINDAFSNYIHDLLVSRVMDLIENTIVADADGQKYATSYHSIQLMLNLFQALTIFAWKLENCYLLIIQINIMV